MHTMRAVVFHGINDIRVDEVPKPRPKAGQAVIRITATTICGTDVHIIRGEYPVRPGACVACTIAPEDDLVVSRLYAPLADVQRLDLVSEHPAAGRRDRLEDLAFDRNADEIVFASNTPFVRSLGNTTLHMRLLAVQPDGERELGHYTFNHSPYSR